MAKTKYFPRPGAWAVDNDGRVGLLYLADIKGGINREEFHIVNKKGETQLIQIRPWIPSAELLESTGHVLRYRREDGTSIEEFVSADFIHKDDSEFTEEFFPWTALSIAPAAKIPANRIAGTSAETLAIIGYV